jgi:hypothetical protein
MSITGFAAKPGTDVEPTWSIRTTSAPNASRTFRASSVYRLGQSGSYGTMTIMSVSIGRSESKARSRAILECCRDDRNWPFTEVENDRFSVATDCNGRQVVIQPRPLCLS